MARPPAYSLSVDWVSTATFPDHSTCSRRTDTGAFAESDALRRLFESVVGRCMKEGIVGARPSRSTPASSWPTPIAGEASPRSRTSIRRPVGQSRNIFRCWMTRPLAGRRRSSPRAISADRSGGPLLHRFSQLCRRLCLLRQLSHRSEACGDHGCRGDDDHSPGRSRGGQDDARPHRGRVRPRAIARLVADATSRPIHGALGMRSVVG